MAERGILQVSCPTPLEGGEHEALVSVAALAAVAHPLPELLLHAARERPARAVSRWLRRRVMPT